VFVVEEGPLGNPPHPKGQRVTWRFSIGIGGAFGMEYASRETVDPMDRNRAGLGGDVSTHDTRELKGEICGRPAGGRQNDHQ
jgi:hypothetical protein